MLLINIGFRSIWSCGCCVVVIHSPKIVFNLVTYCGTNFSLFGIFSIITLDLLMCQTPLDFSPLLLSGTRTIHNFTLDMTNGN
jgi:hypothetical protein